MKKILFLIQPMRVFDTLSMDAEKLQQYFSGVLTDVCNCAKEGGEVLVTEIVPGTLRDATEESRVAYESFIEALRKHPNVTVKYEFGTIEDAGRCAFEKVAGLLQDSGKLDVVFAGPVAYLVELAMKNLGWHFAKYTRHTREMHVGVDNTIAVLT